MRQYRDQSGDEGVDVIIDEVSLPQELRLPQTV